MPLRSLYRDMSVMTRCDFLTLNWLSFVGEYINEPTPIFAEKLKTYANINFGDSSIFNKNYPNRDLIEYFNFDKLSISPIKSRNKSSHG